MTKETLPIDGGQLWSPQMKNEYLNWFASYSMGDWRYEMPATIIQLAYAQFFVRYYIYDLGAPLSKAFKSFGMDMVFVITSMIGICTLLKWAGFLYLDAKMLFKSNEGLLNNLKEGVFIVNEQDFSI